MVSSLFRSEPYSSSPLSCLAHVIFGLILTFSFISTVGQIGFSRFSFWLCPSRFLATPACASAGLPGFWVVGPSLHPFGPILLPRSSYIVSAPAVRYSLSLLFGATSVRSLLEIPRHGVSCYHGTESLGARGPLLTEGLRRYRLVRSPLTPVSLTCSTGVHTVPGHSSLAFVFRCRPRRPARSPVRLRTVLVSHSRSLHTEGFV